MKENFNVEAIKKIWQDRLNSLQPLVEREVALKNGLAFEPCVSDECPDKYVEVASRLVAIQTAKGEIKREDISASDQDKIKYYAKKNGVSFENAIAELVHDAYYVNYDVLEARHVVGVLSEFDGIYAELSSPAEFPMNLMEAENRKWLMRNNNGVPVEERMAWLLEVYRPELAEVKVVNHDYDMLPRSRQQLSAEEIENIKSTLASFADENKNIDKIFHEKNEKYFMALCARLKETGSSFEEFVTKHTDLRYTHCYRADIVPAVKQMVEAYRYYKNTTQGITTQDKYLRSKIEAAQNVTGIHTTKELFDYLNIENDNPSHEAQTMSKADLARKEISVVATLTTLYPDKNIGDNFATNHEKLYDDVQLLTERLGYKTINDFLANHGFTRANAYAKGDRIIYLSERDLLYYRFATSTDSQEDIMERFKECGIAEVDPYENLKIYRRLGLNKQDSTQVRKTSINPKSKQ